jgi:hypothetical protein
MDVKKPDRSAQDTVQDSARRKFVQRSVYVAPAILTLAAAPEFAKAGSVKRGNGYGYGNGNGNGNGNNG